MATIPMHVSGSPSSKTSSSEITLVDKLNTKSPIWKYFGFIPDTNGRPANINKPQCKQCHKEIQTKTSSTTNLFYHLEHKHPELYSELCKVIPEKPEKDEDASSSVQTRSIKEMLES